MRIEVHDRSGLGDQTRAYAEYRVFSMLRNFGHVVRHAAVTLAPAAVDGRRGKGVVCRVAITTMDDVRLETAACGRHPYGAIDGAASRIPSLLARPPAPVT